MSESSATNVGARLADLPPLGWAAKRLEDGLGEFVDTLFAAEFGLARRHWQLLRWVAERGEPRVEAFVDEAATFYTDAEARQVIDDLLDRGWVDHQRSEESDPQLALTGEGRSGFEAMRRAQEATWNVVLDGLDEVDYIATVRAMTTMADNLERANQARKEQHR